ncbi:MAG: hypothetical protein CM15mP55_2330 [Hyphomicrobiales bacterium]|nr:MAG: hypothetical protein CM15mP55_2330 [Hyphomicrobiales bacterium]
MATDVSLQDDDGQIIEGHSISAGSIIRALAPNMLFARWGAWNMCRATDAEALRVSAHHAAWGIIPALEPSLRWLMSAKSRPICRAIMMV